MGKVALVTGGSRGIGQSITDALGKAGFKVAANYIHDFKSAKAMSKQHEIPVFRWDVSDFDACVAGVAAVEHAVGPIDVLVNNAGIVADARIGKMNIDMWNRVLSVNLGGSFNMCKAVFDGMVSRKFGRIINISSINAQAGQFGQANYSASKAGILGLTKSLAQEGASHGVTVNAIAPGYVETEMVASVSEAVLAKIVARVPIGRLGRPDEIARAVTFLADDDAGYVTGSTISVNGGLYMD